MADIANQKGNDRYNEGNLLRAHKYFQEATEIDAKEPKYASNLSAVLFELGRYSACVSAIHTAWGRLRDQSAIDEKPSTPAESNPLAIKIATRLAKAYVNGIANKTILLHSNSPSPIPSVRAIEEDIQKFVTRACKPESLDAKIINMKTSWDQWQRLRDECLHHNAVERGLLVADAEKRLGALPIFKSSSDPTLEYFKVGHDPIRSLLDGLNGDCKDPYALDQLKQDDWALLFGGSGDARHAFGTIVHMSYMSKKHPGLNSIHMTLIDIHPATVARILVVFSIIHQSSEASKRRNEDRMLELETTLFFLYTSMLMPDYCRTIIMNTCIKLVDGIPKGLYDFSKILCINEASAEATLDVLRYWSTPLPKSAKRLLERNPISSISLIPQPTKPSLPNGNNSGVYGDPEAEVNIFKRLRILLPPRHFLRRHPAIEKVVKSYPQVSDAQYASAVAEVENTWQPNPTFFDKISTENPNFGGDHGYPFAAHNPFETLRFMSQFSDEYEDQALAQVGFYKPYGDLGFSSSNRFFKWAANAILRLQAKLKIELVVGDLITGLSKLLNEEMGRRPENFPKSYARMYLSNVPDYTNGILNTAVHLMKYVQPEGLAISNCLLNTGNFSTISDFCYNYSLLLPRDLPRILGCNILTPNGSPFKDIALQSLPLPRSFGELASKKELHGWLAHLLLCVLCNPTPRQPPMWRIEFPNNLNAFIHVLVHLCRVGFPSHWIGDFFQSLLSNNLVTDARPYLGITPIPQSEARNRVVARKLDLNALQAELQVTVASTLPAFPFTVALPVDYPSLADIKTFKAHVKPLDLSLNLEALRLDTPRTYVIRAIGLLFYKPTKTINANMLAHHIHSVIEGAGEVREAQVQIMLNQESVDLDGNVIAWKLSQSWYEKMKEEKWYMAAYRTDLKISVSEPVAAGEWVQL